MEGGISERVGYIEILRINPTYRRYFANVLSMIGTWFTTIALFILASDISGLPNSP